MVKSLDVLHIFGWSWDWTRLQAGTSRAKLEMLTRHQPTKCGTQFVPVWDTGADVIRTFLLSSLNQSYRRPRCCLISLGIWVSGGAPLCFNPPTEKITGEFHNKPERMSFHQQHVWMLPVFASIFFLVDVSRIFQRDKDNDHEMHDFTSASILLRG